MAGRPPSDLQPHQDQRAVEQAASVGRVGPPRRDLERDPRVGDRRLEPRCIARPEDRGERGLGRDTGPRRDADRDAPFAAPHPDPRPGEPGAEPAEIHPLDGRPVGERGGAVAIGPVDADLGAEPLQHAADEPVIARSRAAGVGHDRDPAAVGRGQHQRRDCGMEIHRQGRVARRQRALVGRPGKVGVLAREPDGGIGEQAVAGWQSRDESTLLRQPTERDTEGVLEVRRHRPRTIAPERAPDARRLVPAGASNGPLRSGTRRRTWSRPQSRVRWSGLAFHATLRGRMDDLYRDYILEHYRQPHNFGVDRGCRRLARGLEPAVR